MWPSPADILSDANFILGGLQDVITMAFALWAAWLFVGFLRGFLGIRRDSHDEDED